MLERLFVFRYLFGQSKKSTVRTIALLSVGGIGLGVMAMVVVLSVMGGFDQAIKTRLLGVEPHLVVDNSSGDVEEKIATMVGKHGIVDRYAQQDVIIRTVDGIFSGAVAQGEETKAMVNFGKRVKHNVVVNDSSTGAMATGKNEEVPIDFVLGPRDVAVGADLARSLGIFEGDEITLVAPESLLLPAGEMPIFDKMRVKALIESDVPDIDEHVVFYDVDHGLKKLRDSASLENGLEIRLKNPDDAAGLATKIRAMKVGTVKTWEDMNAALFYSLRMEKTLMGVFLALTVLVSSFSIVSVLFLLVTEKREDVGILKAVGATRGLIHRIFMALGLVLGLLGIVGGTAGGLFICWLLKTYPVIKLPDIYYDTSFPVHVESTVIIGIVVLGILLTLLGTLIPAWKVARYEPISAIRHEDA